MYKIKKIGPGMLDRFNLVLNMYTNAEIKVFDDSDVVSIKGFRLKENCCYNLKLQMLWDIVEEDEVIEYGEKIEFTIIDKVKVGKKELFLVATELGEFYIKADDKAMKIYNSESKVGCYNYTRIDIIQVDDMIHPDYL